MKLILYILTLLLKRGSVVYFNKESSSIIYSSDVDYNLTMLSQLSWGKELLGLSSFFFFRIILKLTLCPFSEVHKAIQKSTGKVVALKRILMNHDCIVNILDMFVVRSKSKNMNIFSLLYWSSYQVLRKTHYRCTLYMVFPYMDHDLAGLLENERVKLQPSHIKLYMKQLLEGTEYMQVTTLRVLIFGLTSHGLESHSTSWYESLQSAYFEPWFSENCRFWLVSEVWHEHFKFEWRWNQRQRTQIHQLRCYEVVSSPWTFNGR